MLTVEKFQALQRVQERIAAIEKEYPHDEAQRVGSQYLASLPETEWGVFVDLVSLLATPQGSAVTGWGEQQIRSILEKVEGVKSLRLEKAAKLTQGKPC